MNFNKLSTSIDFLRKGQVVADPATWKNRQVAVNAVTALLGASVSLAAAFGSPIPVPLSGDELTAVAALLVGGFNIVMTWATSASVGLAPKEKAD